jgi:hypothetical protein
VTGKCLAQPGEPASRSFADRFKRLLIHAAKWPV